MSAILILGFLLGMRHAMEADHVAAVASLSTRSATIGQTVFQGVAWGLGHTLTLFLASSVVLFLDAVIPAMVAQGLEAAVGVMLIILGADVLRRLWQSRVHFHVHRHPDGTVHFHAHSHAGETRHDPLHHEHMHRPAFPVRALCVGMVHGMAGSAALILLTLETMTSPSTGLVYVALFGLGSIGGMALLSAVIALPLRTARGYGWLHNGLQGAVGIVTMVVGTLLMYENGAALI